MEKHPPTYSPDRSLQNATHELESSMSSPGTPQGTPFVAPMGMPALVQRYCALVHQNGWESIEWKQNFTGLHMAAQLGSESAVHFLLHSKAVAILNLPDDKHHMRPIDYAEKAGHTNLVRILDLAGRKVGLELDYGDGDGDGDGDAASLERSLNIEEAVLQQAEEKINALETSEASFEKLVRQLESAETTLRSAHSAEIKRLEEAMQESYVDSGKLRSLSYCEDAAEALVATDLRLSRAEAEVSALRERAALWDNEVNTFAAQLTDLRLEQQKRDRQLAEKTELLDSCQKLVEQQTRQLEGKPEANNFAAQLADLRLELEKRDRQLTEKTELLDSCQKLVEQQKKQLERKPRRTVSWADRRGGEDDKRRYSENRKESVRSGEKITFDLTQASDFPENYRRSMVSHRHSTASSRKSEVWSNIDTDSDGVEIDLTKDL